MRLERFHSSSVAEKHAASDVLLSDDVYRSRFEVTVASLRYWVPQIKDVARVEDVSTDDYFRLTVMPEIVNACPFELLLRADQHHDWSIGGETYEDLKVTSFDSFLAMVDAIAAGRVLQRRWFSAATGTERRIETIVTLADGRIWLDGRTLPGAPAHEINGALTRADHHFVPYHR